MKLTLGMGAVIIVVGTIAFFVLPGKNATPTPSITPVEKAETSETQKPEANNDVTPSENGRIANPDTQASTEAPAGKLKVINFTGTLEKVDTGCFSDGECFVVVDGKHITTIMGWSQAEVGSVLGVDGFGDLEQHIGEKVEVYAKDNADGTYTLYGSNGFYIKLVK